MMPHTYNRYSCLIAGLMMDYGTRNVIATAVYTVKYMKENGLHMICHVAHLKS